MEHIPTSSQTLGPFFRYALARPEWSDLSAGASSGECILITGRLFDGAHDPVPDGMIEIWQADAAGEYPRPDASQDAFRGFGRACTDHEGRFSFRTIKPGVAGSATPPQAPHINVTIFARGLTKALNTRMYFADFTDENGRDSLLCSLGERKRATMIATRGTSAAIVTYEFDIILQGEGETVFLEI